MREVVCHCFCACVCSGHIPNHWCCSVYVISRVRITFHITLTPHHIKRFHITHSVTSHQKILHHTTFHVTPFHTTPFHITPPLHNIPHHITTYQCFCHATSRRQLMFATHLTSDHHILHLRSRYTAVCLGTTISHHHISKHMFHITKPQSTSHTIPHPQLFYTTPTFNITAYFTPQHIPHRITPPHLG